MINNNRVFSLDALRGYAIITMVLSGAVVFGILPRWMYHAQCPPPACTFDPSVFGITWVDLVFPFFLFAMGAAFPLSVGRRIENGEQRWKAALKAIWRGVKLTFFAIFIQHLYPWVTSSPIDMHSSLLALSGFVLLFPMFMRIPGNLPQWARIAIEFLAFGAGILLMLSINYPSEKTFDLGFSNIIILVLANMSIFGTLSYLFTMKNRWARVGILPFLMAILLIGNSPDVVDSWQRIVLDYSPIPWMYNFSFLKYLFIIIPGTIAGEYLVEWVKNRKEKSSQSNSKNTNTLLILIFCVGIIIFNLWGLLTRNLVINLAGNVAMLFVMYKWLYRGNSVDMRFWKKLFIAGAYMLMLGLFFESFEGGIRKDYSTYSYYFVTSGLAFFALTAFSIMCDIYRWRFLTLPLEMAGQNPMIAYVASALFILPLLHLTGLDSYLNLFEETPLLGFLKGVIITALAVMVAMFFTRIKWFWRT